jgi:hypothetical protein
VSGFLAHVAPPDRLAPLVRDELRLAAHLHAVRLGARAALAAAPAIRDTFVEFQRYLYEA